MSEFQPRTKYWDPLLAIATHTGILGNFWSLNGISLMSVWRTSESCPLVRILWLYHKSRHPIKKENKASCDVCTDWCWHTHFRYFIRLMFESLWFSCIWKKYYWCLKCNMERITWARLPNHGEGNMLSSGQICLSTAVPAAGVESWGAAAWGTAWPSRSGRLRTWCFLPVNAEPR